MPVKDGEQHVTANSNSNNNSKRLFTCQCVVSLASAQGTDV